METQKVKETQHLKRVVEVGQTPRELGLSSLHIQQKGDNFFSVWVETEEVFLDVTSDGNITIWKANEISIGSNGKTGRSLITKKVRRF